MKKIKMNNFKESLYYEELNNGLKVYAVPIKNKKSFAAMLVIKYGSRDIKFKIDDKMYKTPTGIAHFLEHKMFEREDDPFKFYQKYGTDVNAATSDDYTCYYFIGNKYFDKSLKYLLNWAKTLKVTDKGIKKEQGIILEEKSMYKDNPNRVIYNKIRENIYIKDPKKNEVIGTTDDIKNITQKDLELCYNNFYVPNNMYLIVTGNINPKKVIEITKDYTKNFKKNSHSVTPIYGKEPDMVAHESDTLKMNVEIPKVAVAYKINKKVFKNLNITPFELDVYLHYLINISLGTTSEIRQKWLENNLFTDAFYRISEIESHYIIEFYANSNKEEELIKNLENYIKNLETTEEAFEREKKIWIAAEIKGLDNPLTVVYSVLDDLLDYDYFIPNKIEYIRKLNYETLNTIKNTLVYDNKSIIRILPKN